MHTCLLERDGTIACWGANSFWGTLLWDRNNGAATPPAGAFTRLSTGKRSCALDENGEVACWGLYTPTLTGTFIDVAAAWSGVCGLRSDGTVSCSNVSTRSGNDYVALTGSEGFACALTNRGRVRCWNHYGGNAVPGPACETFLQVSAGFAHACGVKWDATIACWGDDTHGQASPPTGEFAQVSAGAEHSCALRTNGTIVCWGAAEQTRAPDGEYVQVSSGYDHSCALRDDDKVRCWGRDHALQLEPPWEIATADDTYARVFVAGTSFIDDEETDDNNDFLTTACGLRADGSLECWGGAVAPAGGPFVDVYPGTGATCAVDESGALRCRAGQQGVGLPPASVLSATISDLSFGYMQACAVKNNGELECWQDGNDVQGEQPTGSFVAVSVATNAYDPSLESQGRVYEAACAVRSNGDVVCWGAWGMSGAATLEGPFIDVIAQNVGAHAIRSDGTVVSWPFSGDPEPVPGTYAKISGTWSTYGLRSDGKIVYLDGADAQNAPVDDTFVDISASGDFACGVRTDGHVRCWGSRVR